MKAKPATQVAWREIDGETVLVDLKRSLMVAVNRPGGLLWRAIQEGADLDALAGMLTPDAPAEGRRLAGSFIAQLEGCGLVESEGLGELADTGPDETAEHAPRVLWQEDLSSFVQQAASCGRLPSQGGQCQIFKRF
jgi:hypothetical protein